MRMRRHQGAFVRTLLVGFAGAALFIAGGCEQVLGFDRAVGVDEPDADPCGTAAAGSCSGDGGQNDQSSGGTSRGGSSGGSTAGTGGIRNSGGGAGTGGKSGAGASGGTSDAGASDAGDGGVGGASTDECENHADCSPLASAGCIVRCELGAAGRICVVHPADADGDEHGSAACVPNPGDDCDDDRDDVYPMAEELCDGIDNDCDLASDLDDGYVLSGSTVVIAPGPLYGANIDVAWSPEADAYGVAWTQDIPYFQPMALSGDRPFDPVPLTDDTTHAISLAIEAGGGAFAVSWEQDFVYFRTAYPDTTLGSEPLLVPDEAGFGSFDPALAWIDPAQAWALSWTDYRNNTAQVIWRTVSPLGELGSEIGLDEPAWASSVAAKGDTIVGAWTGNDFEGASAAKGVRFPSATGTPAALELGGVDPIVAANADGFGVISQLLPDKLEFVVFNDDGTLKCGPERIESEGFTPTDMVPSSNGFLIVSGKPNVQALEVFDDCHFGRRIDIDPAVASKVRAAAARDGGFAIVWMEWNTVSHVITALKARTFGPHFCD